MTDARVENELEERREDYATRRFGIASAGTMASCSPRIPYSPPHEVGWFSWLRFSKRISGVTLLFHSRQETRL